MLKQNLQLIDDNSEGKKSKGTKKCASNGKRKIENCKSCLEAIQLENEINHLEKKNEIDIDHIKENHKEFIENNKSILKSILKHKDLKVKGVMFSLKKINHCMMFKSPFDTNMHMEQAKI